MEMLTINNTAVVIILQYISVSNQYIVYFECYIIHQLCLNKFWEKYLSYI